LGVRFIVSLFTAINAAKVGGPFNSRSYDA
jgi:hypothetical protein